MFIIQSNTIGRQKPKDGNYKESAFWKLSNILENNKKLLNYDPSPLKDMLGSTAKIMSDLAQSHGYLENEILLMLGNVMTFKNFLEFIFNFL